MTPPDGKCAEQAGPETQGWAPGWQGLGKEYAGEEKLPGMRFPFFS